MLNKFDELRIKGEILSKLWEYLDDEFKHAIMDRDDANAELAEMDADNFRYATTERIANEYAYKATAIKDIMNKLDKLV